MYKIQNCHLLLEKIYSCAAADESDCREEGRELKGDVRPKLMQFDWSARQTWMIIGECHSGLSGYGFMQSHSLQYLAALRKEVFYIFLLLTFPGAC